jgi:hypothetical protein
MSFKQLRLSARVTRACALAVTIGGLVAATSAAPAPAFSFVHGSSAKVALIPKNGPVPPRGPDGVMPVSAYVSGRPAESFARFSFSNVPLDQITTAKLSQFDTVAMIQVKVTDLTPAAKAALAQFVANGGKLLIHDGDKTKLNDYSWLLGGPYSTRVATGCEGCGGTSGTTTITNSSLISTNPADPSYVNVSDVARFTDAIGDANLLVSTDPRWFTLAAGTNSTSNNETGSQVAFANHKGLIVYNGFDTDFVKTTPSDPWRCNQPALGYRCPSGSTPTVDWIAHMWYSELVQGWGTPTQPGAGGGDGTPGGVLPNAKPIAKTGVGLAAAQAGLASNGACVSRTGLFVRLKRLSRLHRGAIAQVDVYVNGRLRVRERGHLANVTLTHLPRRRPFTVEIIVTTKRGYHLIAKQRYRGC